jgi:hypothetical protein
MLSKVFESAAGRIGTGIASFGFGQQLFGLAVFFNDHMVSSATSSASGTTCVAIGAAVIAAGAFHLARKQTQVLKQD